MSDRLCHLLRTTVVSGASYQSVNYASPHKDAMPLDGSVISSTPVENREQNIKDMGRVFSILTGPMYAMEWRYAANGTNATSTKGVVMSVFDKVVQLAAIILVVLVVGLLLRVFSLEAQVSRREAQVIELSATLREYSAANEKFSTAVASQNAALATWQEETAKRSKAAEEAIAAIVSKSNRWKTKYEALLRSPPSTNDPCRALGQRFGDYLKLRMDNKL